MSNPKINGFCLEKPKLLPAWIHNPQKKNMMIQSSFLLIVKVIGTID